MIKMQREIIPADVFEELLTLGEGYKAEFKVTLPSSISIAKSLCAFANTKGGNLFIGVNDSGITVGVNNKISELNKLEEALPLILPRPDFTVKTVTHKDHDILYIEIKEGNNKPYYVSDDSKTQAYIRTGDTNLPAGKKELKIYTKNRDQSGKNGKGLKNDEKIVKNLFEQERRLHTEQIVKKLNYSERRLKKILLNLTRLGVINPSTNENNVYFVASSKKEINSDW
jgi:predicted HTH transcriptional regulator